MPHKILLIDDDPSVTTLLRLKLQGHGAIVETSNAVRQAVGIAESFQPDLVVCDIDLGQEGDGGMVAHELAKKPTTASIPVIFLSSMVNPEDATQQSGGRKLISKKMPMTQIIGRILLELV